MVVVYVWGGEGESEGGRVKNYEEVHVMRGDSNKTAWMRSWLIWILTVNIYIDDTFHLTWPYIIVYLLDHEHLKQRAEDLLRSI